MLHRQSARHRLVAAAAATVTAWVLVPEPGHAVPDGEAGGSGRCETTLFGVSSANRVLRRDLEDDRVASSSVVPRSLPFAVTSMGYADSGTDSRGFFFELVSQNADKRLRLITVRYRGDLADGRWTARPLANPTFPHRLLTSSPAGYFAVDAKGVLRRWHLLFNDRGQRYLGAGKVVRRGLGGLKTLTHYGTFSTAGGRTAILFGTTRTGGLVQIRVVDRNPDRVDEPVGTVRLVWLRKSGFEKYDTATLGECDVSSNQAAITLIDRDANRARLYTLSQAVTAPAGRRLVDVGEVGPNAQWQFRAAF